MRVLQCNSVSPFFLFVFCFRSSLILLVFYLGLRLYFSSSSPVQQFFFLPSFPSSFLTSLFHNTHLPTAATTCFASNPSISILSPIILTPLYTFASPLLSPPLIPTRAKLTFELSIPLYTFTVFFLSLPSLRAHATHSTPLVSN